MRKLLLLVFIPALSGTGTVFSFEYLLMKLLYPLLPVFVFILSFYSHHTVDESLDRVENIMEEQPDSALLALQRLDFPYLPDNKTYARYCLLMTQALYKNHTPPANDSLISIAYYHFGDGPDSLLKARTCFYYGRYYEQQQKMEGACRFYHTALRAAESTNDNKLNGLIHYSLGDIFLLNKLVPEAIEEYKTSIGYFDRIENKEALCFSFLNLGATYLLDRKEDSAFYYYQKALDLSEQNKNKDFHNKVLSIISSHYRKEGKFDQALDAINQAISGSPDSVNLNRLYFVKGNTYFESQQYDSAQYYYSLSTQSNSIYTSTGSYYQLYKLSRRLQKWEEASDYVVKYWTGRHKIESITTTKDIAEIQAKYDKQELELKNNRLQLIRNRIATALGIVVPSFFYLLFYFLKKRRHDALTMDRERAMLLNVLFTKRDEICQKEEEIKRLTRSRRQLEEKLIWSTVACQKIRRIEYNRLHFMPASRGEETLTEEDWSELMGCIDAVTGNSLTEFIETQTRLSKEDIRYCCLWKLQVKTVDIATIFQVNENSVNKRKSRIKQKLTGKYANGQLPDDLSLLF